MAALTLLSQVSWAAPTSQPVPVPAPVPPPAPVTTGPRYFFHLDLDGRYQITGQGELTEAAAATANCYRFVTRSDGKLAQIEYRRAGVAAPDPFFQVAQIDFEYQAGIERRWFRDGENQPQENCDQIQGEELTVNPAGYPTDVTNLDATGARKSDKLGVIHYTRTLDNLGRVITGQRIGFLGTPVTDDVGWYETRTIYDNDSRVIEYANFDSSGQPLANKEGVAVKRTIWAFAPDMTQISNRCFDGNGLATVEKDSGVHEVRSTFDNRGFLLDEAFFDPTGSPCAGHTLNCEYHERRLTWDERGNMLSQTFIDSDGSPLEEKSLGYAKAVYRYDNLNRLAETDYFGDDGGPVIVPSLGAAMVKREYAADGTTDRYFDGLGHPVPCEEYGATVIHTGQAGDRTVITLHDRLGHLTKNAIGGYATVTYKTDAEGKPLRLTYRYYDRFGYPLSYFPRIAVINPHLYAMRQEADQIARSGSRKIPMQSSARYGAGAAGIGALLASFLALRKSSYTRRRKIYVPGRIERFLGWLATFAILEGTLRFFLTVYWWWLGHHYARMGHTIYVIEGLIIAFFLWKLLRMRVTMRVLNIEREQIHGLIRAFYARANLKPDWEERRRTYTTGPLDVRLRFFQSKHHAYLAFRRRKREGSDLARALAQYLRSQVRILQAPARSRLIALYYPSVALCYFLLSGTAFYTLWQLVKRY